MSGVARVGISGWTYPGWRGEFYPKGLVHREELAYAAQRLSSIEINGSFYALQKPESYENWRGQVPDGFVFSVKANRFVTHMKRLRDPEQSLPNFLASGVLALGDQLGPMLWQLPPNMRFDADRLSAFFRALPRTTAAAAELATRHDDKVPDDRALTVAESERPLRHAVEGRHESFGRAEVRELFAEHDIAFVTADTAGRYPFVTDRTADFRYVRLHGDEELYVSGYTDSALDEWAERVASWTSGKDGCDVFVYFDNDVKARAPFDAMGLIRRLDAG